MHAMKVGFTVMYYCYVCCISGAVYFTVMCVVLVALCILFIL